MEVMKMIAYFNQKTEGERHFRRHRHCQKDDIKMDLGKMCEDMDKSHLALDSV
jgi:hypothetical protein